MKKSFVRKTAVGALCISLISSGISIPNVSAASLGDVNQDNTVSVADIVSLQKYLVNKGTLSSAGKTNADMNSDGKVNVFDLSILKNAVSTPFADTVKIHLSDSGITVENDAKNVVSISGKIVTISASGKYIVDGTINEGQIFVNIPDVAADSAAAEVTLSSVSITNSTMPCIYSQSADKLKITAVGTNNLTDTATAARSDSPACIYSLTDTTITKNSGGTLNITSSFNRGIDCNEDLSLNGGTININTDVDDLSDCDAIKARETVSVDGAKVIIDSSADGIKSGKRNVEILSGSVEIKAGNDAIQAATSIDIAGGTVIAGGDRGLRLDDGGLLNITGGNVIATATDYQITNAAESLATVNISGSTQNIMLLDFAAQQKKNQAVTLTQNGKTAFEMDAIKKFNYAIVSSSGIAANTDYNLYVGGVKQGHTGGTITEFNMTSNGAEFIDIQAAGGASVSDNAAASIVYNGSNVSILNASGQAVASPSNLTVSGSKVTITEPSVISVSGKSDSAQIVVDCDKTAYPEGIVELDLIGAELSNTSAAPIYVKQVGDEVQIVAKSGTVNTISDGTSHSDTNTKGETIPAAIYAEDDLKIKGSGTITVNGNTEDGIATKNDLKIYNGTINVTAKDDALRGGDSVTIGNDTAADYSGLKLTVNASAGDGIKANDMDTTSGKGFITVNGGTVNVTACSDGFHASQNLNINGGDITIKTTGTSSSTSDASAKGLKAGKTDDTTGTTVEGVITINSGHIDADTKDDCVHASGNIYLYGGVLELNSGDDAVHSDSDLTIGKGNNTFDDLTVIVESCYEGMEAKNITQNSGSVIINSTDDGYNAAGGADGSGNMGLGGWGGGWNMGGSSSGDYSLTINGGFALVNATDGDHDGFDSNGTFALNGGYIVTNGNEPIDSDGTQTYTGGVYVKDTGSGGMGMGGGMGGWGGPGGMGGSSSMTQSVSASVSANAGTRITICDGSGNVIISFIADKNVTSVIAGCIEYTGAAVYTGGELTGSTYFQTTDQTQLAAYGGKLTGGTAAGSGSSSTNSWR
ncbi:MAG: carbohydrate-binding domain-containing protein [Ruminococcus sp.]|nr:carbohydrate-binding domain-containing protein [Ruminococcus sp.]